MRAARTVKALVVHALSDDFSGTALAELPDPVAGPGQILIRVEAASLNYPDLLMTRGQYQLKPPTPFIPGMEVAGEVVSGEGFAPGTQVVAGTRVGGLAELVAVDAAAARAIPDKLSVAEAASVGTAYLTAYVALVRLAAIRSGEWVLVHGATGGVGLAAVDLAQAMGAKVIATSRSEDKLAAVRDLYAPDATLPATGFREDAKALSGGGVDIAFDPVGGDVFDETVRTMAFGGRLLVIGFTSGRIATVATNIPLIKGFSVIGVRAGEYGRRFPDRGRENLDAIWAMAADGRIRPHVHAEIALDDWRTAFDAMDRSAMVGKLILVP